MYSLALTGRPSGLSCFFCPIVTTVIDWINQNITAMKYRIFRESEGWDPYLMCETNDLQGAIGLRNSFKKEDERHEYTIMQFVDVEAM